MENGLTKDESESIAKAIYEMQMLGLNVINSEEIKLTEELDKLKETTIERILLKKDINLFGFYFSKGCLVLLVGDHLELKYGESNRYVTIPLICGTFGKTSAEFMTELSKQNNN